MLSVSSYTVSCDRDPAGNELPKSVMNRITLFQRKQKKDTIDVWWLYDDGGIVCFIVIPYTIFVKYDRLKRDRSNTFAAGYHQLQNKLVRDSVANILHSFWRRRTGEGTKRVRFIVYL